MSLLREEQKLVGEEGTGRTGSAGQALHRARWLGEPGAGRAHSQTKPGCGLSGCSSPQGAGGVAPTLRVTDARQVGAGTRRRPGGTPQSGGHRGETRFPLCEPRTHGAAGGHSWESGL